MWVRNWNVIWLLTNTKILELHYAMHMKSTKLSRLHNNANVMTIGSRLTKKNVALKCVKHIYKN